MQTDVLVIGSGIAGLSYALEFAALRPEASITLLTKREVLESNTKYAQGGIAVVQDFVSDSFESHVADTLKAGDGLCDPEVVRFVVKEGPDRLKQLLAWGTYFDSSKDQFHLGKEGGHSAYRIVHYKDQSGFEIQKSLIKALKSYPNIRLLENHTLVDLITDHHHNQSSKNECYGAYVISLEDLKVVKINAQITVLSTGGAGQIYDFSTNPEGATGDGLAAAYRAKVRIENLQYVQFHPTALAHKIKGNTFLISEAVRGAGAYLRNATGARFMFEHDLRGELASRDIVARGIEMEMNKGKAPFVYLDATHFDNGAFETAFPHIFENCLSVDIDPRKDLIPVRAAAHYFCGGIQVNRKGETSLARLYAIGECSYTGLHGANRLASNSLLEALVYAHAAVGASAKALGETLLEKAFFKAIPNWDYAQQIIDKDSKKIRLLKREVQQLLSSKAAIFKTSKGLEQAEKAMAVYYAKAKELYNTNQLTPQICELRNLVNVGHLMIKQSQACTQNRGGFYNQDYEV
jgi:L-aspartate oxidase